MSDSQKYVVSARKYRPMKFADMVGQQSLAATLKSAIETHRLAQAYLFCGPRGVGKTSCARIFARRINCDHPTPEGDACGECESCREMMRGSSFNVMELDAASNNGVDSMRALTDQVNVAPPPGKYRVFIIDEVHMLTTAAFNAFLKTLEEPPANVIFIMATTEKHKVIPTILSRCQIYDFKRIEVADIARHLQHVADSEGIKAEPAALSMIAQKADGAMRDALSIFDQMATSSGGNITYDTIVKHLNVLDYEYYFRLTDLLRDHDVEGALLAFKEIRDRGFDALYFVQGLADHVRNLLVAMDSRTLPLLEVGPGIEERYQAQARALPREWYYAAMDLINECDLNYRTVLNKQFLIELTLVKLCRIGLGMGPQVSLQPQPQQSAPQQPQQPQQPQPQAQAPQQPQTQAIQQPQPQATQQPQPQATQQPQPQATQQPQPQQQAPQPAAPKRPAAARHTQGGAPSLRLSSISSHPEHQPAAEAPKPAAAPTPAPAPVAETVVSVPEAWRLFIERHPERHNLVAAMQGAEPRQLQGEAYLFLVENPKQAEDMEHTLPELVPFMRSNTGLQNFSLQVKVAQRPDEQRQRPMTDQQFLREAVNNNPSLKDLLTRLDVEFT